jgi:hypothetical protein
MKSIENCGRRVYLGLLRDIRHHVLAENITKEYIDRKPYGWTIEFDFLCPNCGRRHWSRETVIAGIIKHVEYELQCGLVKVRMPWADCAAARDKEPIVGGA